MNKNIIYKSLHVIITLVIFSSCNKETPYELSNSNQLSDSELSAKIRTFRSSMIDSRKSSTTETMNFGEAVWLMEAAFNYYHGFTDGDYLVTKTDSVYVNVDYNNLDEVSISELQQIFVASNNMLTSNFDELNLENKRTILFDIELEATTQGNQLLIMMTSGSMNTQKAASPAVSSVVDPFGSTDYWTPGYISDDIEDATGKCGSYTGTFIGVSDATFEQEKAARKYRRGTMFCRYFVDIDTYPIYDPVGFEGEDSECIEPLTMNEYYEDYGDRINYWYSYFNVSSSKQFVDFNLKNDFLVGGNGYYLRTYIDWIKFGQKKFRELEEAPSALYSLP